MIKNNASDLHLTTGVPIIFRIDGEIKKMNTPPISQDDMDKYFSPIIPKQKIKDFNTSWDIDFSYEIKNVGRYRINIFRDNNGVGSVIRVIPSKIPTSEDLNLPEVLINFCKLSKGLLLVTGPTESGKSTTLAAMIDWINKNRKEHILTIEDPIEFVHSQQKCLVNQREVGKHTDSFAKALRAALREDPDIILVGELRDLETTSIAIETAETGHLVMATLHTNTAISTVDRIVDQYPADQQRIIRNMLASSMKGVVSQTLCKKIGGGRCPAFEILVMSDPVAAMIRENKIHMINNHMLTSQSEGNLQLNESLINLINSGSIDYKEAWSRAVDKKQFEEIAQRKK